MHLIIPMENIGHERNPALSSVSFTEILQIVALQDWNLQALSATSFEKAVKSIFLCNRKIHAGDLLENVWKCAHTKGQNTHFCRKLDCSPCMASSHESWKTRKNKLSGLMHWAGGDLNIKSVYLSEFPEQHRCVQTSRSQISFASLACIKYSCQPNPIFQYPFMPAKCCVDDTAPNTLAK